MTHPSESNVEQLISVLQSKRNIWVLTGAGISLASGIPTYRDHKGKWLAANPIQHGEFISQQSHRQRYWARSMAGWKINQHAEPNVAHHAITQLQNSNKVNQVVTQNVDRLHSIAGTKNVIDLHGRIDQVKCLNCGDIIKRDDYQPRLEEQNPILGQYISEIEQKYLPDGDADINDFDMSLINIPPCENCGGILKPNVIFFGGTVPKQRVETAFETLADSDCCLVIGSSLTVYSGFRFPRWASQNNIPLYAINKGEMRGGELFDLVVSEESCEQILPIIVNALI